MTKSWKNRQLGDAIAYSKAKYTTRCMVCGVQIEKGSVIATPTEDRKVIRNAQTKARWAHPSCLTDALRVAGAVSAMPAGRGFRERAKRRRANTRRAEAEQNKSTVEAETKESQ